MFYHWLWWINDASNITTHNMESFGWMFRTAILLRGLDGKTYEETYPQYNL